jgi:hypothetical protein
MSGDNHDKQGATFLDSLARMTKIVGSPSLDEQFGNGRNPFDLSMEDANRRMKQQIRNGGNQ